MARPNGYLLDTGIIVALVRGNDLGKYLEQVYGLTAGPQRYYVAIVVVGESRALAAKWNWGPARQTRLARTMRHFVPIDIGFDPILDAYAELDAWSASVGNDMGKNDLWIAAVARVYDLTLLTTDKDFDHLHHAGLVDVTWVDPASK